MPHHHKVLHAGSFGSLDQRNSSFAVYLLDILECTQEVSFWRANGRHNLRAQRTVAPL